MNDNLLFDCIIPLIKYYEYYIKACIYSNYDKKSQHFLNKKRDFVLQFGNQLWNHSCLSNIELIGINKIDSKILQIIGIFFGDCIESLTFNCCVFDNNNNNNSNNNIMDWKSSIINVCKNLNYIEINNIVHKIYLTPRNSVMINGLQLIYFDKYESISIHKNIEAILCQAIQNSANINPNNIKLIVKTKHDNLKTKTHTTNEMTIVKTESKTENNTESKKSNENLDNIDINININNIRCICNQLVKKDDLLDHQSICQESKINCVLCNIKIKRKMIVSHWNNNCINYKCICFYCQKSFLGRIKLLKHLKIHREKSDMDNQKYDLFFDQFKNENYNQRYLFKSYPIGRVWICAKCQRRNIDTTSPFLNNFSTISASDKKRLTFCAKQRVSIKLAPLNRKIDFCNDCKQFRCIWLPGF